MLDDNHRLKGKVLAYQVTVRKKHGRHPEDARQIHGALAHIRSLAYKRRSSEIDDPTSRLQHIGDHDLALEIAYFSPLSQHGLCRLDFYLGRESSEVFPTRNPQGRFRSTRLAQGLNLCFKTHGRFFFAKRRGMWCCVLLIERRHNTTGLGAFIQYLEKLFPHLRFEPNLLAAPTAVLQRLRELDDLQLVILKDVPVSFSHEAGWGSIQRQARDQRKYRAVSVRLKVDSGSAPTTKLRQVFHAIRGPTRFTEQAVAKFAADTDLVLFAKKSGEARFQHIDILQDVAKYALEVRQMETRDISTRDFFHQLTKQVPEPEAERLLRLSRQLYDDVEVVNAADDPQQREADGE